MITVNENIMQFQLDTAHTSYVMRVKEGFLEHVYWGRRLASGDHTYMRRELGRASFSPRMENCRGPILDDLPLEYPCFGRGDLRSPALEVVNPDGSDIADLRYVSYTVCEGKPALAGLPAFYAEKGDNVRTLCIKLRDDVSMLECDLYYTVFYDYDLITRHAELTNHGESTLALEGVASACVDIDRCDFDIVSNYGTHEKERMIERTPLVHGKMEFASRRGSSGHVHNPFIILASRSADEVKGEVYALTLVYSGCHSMSAEGGQYDSCRVLAGINPDGFRWRLGPGETFVTPEAALVHTEDGLGGMSHIFHRAINDRLIRGKYRNRRRPVLLNSWEAVYFKFDEEKLMNIGSCAADLGMEMLVIDDGWFGRRDDDHSSLGDWYINRSKLPNGFDNIHKMLHEKGCGLGIWFEPEMISPDSDLYRAHPDWCLHVEGRPRSEGRHQLMLDLSRPDVCEYIYESVASLLRTGTVDYIKWDFNRNVAEVGSALLAPEKQGEVLHRYYLGLYSVLERLHNDFPDVLFESCSGGGGRYDCGILYYMPQTWTSDNSDAVERLKIQYGTSLIYPLSSMTGHVSASPNHQTGHVTPFDTRFNVALTGSFGYELDPTKLTDEEKRFVTGSADIYKKYGDTLVNGDYYRLRSNYTEDCAAWCIVARDKSVCIAVYVNAHVRVYPRNEHLVLRGVDGNARYRETRTGAEYSGSQLLGYGVPVDKNHEYSSELWIFERI